MRLGFVKFAVLFIGVVLMTSVAASFLASTFLPVPPDFPAPDVKTSSSQYLPYFDSLSSNPDDRSRIFLLSAEPRYGYFKATPQGFMPPPGKKWDTCLILDVTIRNEYSEEHPLQLDSWNPWDLTDGYYVTIASQLYDKDGSVRVRYESVSCGESAYRPTVKMESGETLNFDFYIATESRDIDYVEFYLIYIGGPPPVPA